MFKKLKTNLFKNYFEYALYLFASSFFWGNAAISIAYVIFLLAAIPEVYKNFKLKEFLNNRGLVLLCLFFLLNLVIVVILHENFEEIFKIIKLHYFLVLPIIIFSSRGVFKENKNILFTLSKVFVFSAFISFSLSFIYGLYRMFFAEININSIYITYNHLAELLEEFNHYTWEYFI